MLPEDAAPGSSTDDAELRQHQHPPQPQLHQHHQHHHHHHQPIHRATFYLPPSASSSVTSLSAGVNTNFSFGATPHHTPSSVLASTPAQAPVQTPAQLRCRASISGPSHPYSPQPFHPTTSGRSLSNLRYDASRYSLSDVALRPTSKPHAPSPMSSSYAYAANGKPIIKSWASHAPAPSGGSSSSTSNNHSAAAVNDSIDPKSLGPGLGPHDVDPEALDASPHALAVMDSNGQSISSSHLSSSTQSISSTHHPRAPPAGPTAPKNTPLHQGLMEMKNYLICDSMISDTLKNEPHCSVIQEDVEIQGYEIYIVEQWACERKLNRVIVSYTGNPLHKALVNIVALPHEKSQSSSASSASMNGRRKSIFSFFPEIAFNYFEELAGGHAHPKSNDKGTIYVSNLSSFPSNLNLILVPNGNLKQVWSLFGINENLKRTGCGGRSVLSLSMPTAANEDKFRQLFKTHEKVPVAYAVRELIMLVQIGLYYFDLLKPQYVDGLLCNETLKATNLWWDRFAPMRYHGRYADRQYLLPQSAAGIIGLVTGVRNRIATILGNSKTCKDPFDIEYFLETVRQFQKHQHMSRTVKLDTGTVSLLLSQTSGSSANSESSSMPVNSGGDKFFGMVKSTVKEVSGKTSQSVGDVETLDINRMKDFLQGPRTRYLWLNRGNARKFLTRHTASTLSLGIPLEAFSPSELLTASESKWPIPRRGLPGSKKQLSSPETFPYHPPEDPKLHITPAYLNTQRVDSPPSTSTADPTLDEVFETPAPFYGHNNASTKPTDHSDSTSINANLYSEERDTVPDSIKLKQPYDSRLKMNGEYESAVESASDFDANDRSELYNDSDMDDFTMNSMTQESGSHAPSIAAEMDAHHDRDRGHSFDTEGSNGSHSISKPHHILDNPNDKGSKGNPTVADANGKMEADDSHHKLEGVEHLIARFHSSSKKMEEALFSGDEQNEHRNRRRKHLIHRHGRSKSENKNHRDIFKKIKGQRHRSDDAADADEDTRITQSTEPQTKTIGLLSPEDYDEPGYSTADSDSYGVSGPEDENDSNPKDDGVNTTADPYGDEGYYDADEEGTDYIVDDDNFRPVVDLDLTKELWRARSEPDLMTLFSDDTKHKKALKKCTSAIRKTSLYSLDSHSSTSSSSLSSTSSTSSLECPGSPPPVWQTTTYRIIQSPQHKLSVLRRCQSFSLIESHLDFVYGESAEGKPPFFAPNPIKIYRNYQVAQALSFKVEQSLNRFDRERVSYHLLDNKVRDLMEKTLHTKTRQMNTEIQGVVQKEAALKRGLTELETLTARLQYEARTMDLKIRDIEESVMSFANRVDSLEERMNKLDYESSAHTKQAAAASSQQARHSQKQPLANGSTVKNRKEKSRQFKNRRARRRSSSTNMRLNTGLAGKNSGDASGTSGKTRRSNGSFDVSGQSPTETEASRGGSSSMPRSVLSNIQKFLWGTVASAVPALANGKTVKKSQNSPVSGNASQATAVATGINGASTPSTPREPKQRKKPKIVIPSTPVTPISEDRQPRSAAGSAEQQQFFHPQWETPFASTSDEDDYAVYDTDTENFSGASRTTSATASPVLTHRMSWSTPNSNGNNHLHRRDQLTRSLVRSLSSSSPPPPLIRRHTNRAMSPKRSVMISHVHAHHSTPLSPSPAEPTNPRD